MASLVMQAANLGAQYVQHERLRDYTWIFAVEVVFAWFAAYGIGANDVANAFGTSVASRAITMRQAVVIAAVCEFCGAFFLGAQVTSTIAGGIAKGYKFSRDPELLMFGMMCVDLAVALWLWLATYLELPVSTTHSAVGGVIGMALVLGGPSAVYWTQKTSDPPGVGGVVGIVISWITSPILSAIAAMILFFLVRTFVLRHANSFQRSMYALPLIIGVTVAINLMFLIKKGGKNQGGGTVPESTVQLSSWLSGLGVCIITLLCMPLVRKKILKEEAAAEAAEAEGGKADAEAAKTAEGGKADAEAARSHEEGKEGTEGAEAASTAEGGKAGAGGAVEAVNPQAKSSNGEGSDKASSFFIRFKNATVDRNVHAEVSGLQKVQDIHAHAERFDERTEESFKYLQVFTAMCNSLAHGANDVANAIGPLAAVAQIWKTGSVSSKSSVPRWVLSVGATGLVVGLATYGYNIIRVLGLKTIKITATRGFAIELGSALVVLVASYYGLPVSTTHCMVGATVGVGALEGGGGVHWLLFVKMIGGWLATLVVAGTTAAFFVAVGAYAPSQQMAEKLRHYEDGLRLRSELYNYAYQWQADAAGTQGVAAVMPPVLNNSGYFYAVVPDHPSEGVPSDKSYLQWNEELWQDAGAWTKTTSWEKVWQQAIGYEAPEYKGANSSTVAVPQVFSAFDRVQAFAFSPNQQAEIEAVLRGDKVLCCDTQYKCCPRTCDYKKVDDDCEGKCEMVSEKEGCKEKACGDDDKQATISAAKLCILVDNEDECPVTMDINDPKNYVGPNYVSNPITAPPPPPFNTSYGKQFTDWREPDYDLTVHACPVKL